MIATPCPVSASASRACRAGPQAECQLGEMASSVEHLACRVTGTRSRETADINHVGTAGGMMAIARCRESTSVSIRARSSSSSKHAAAALARAKHAGEPRQCDTAHTSKCNVSGSFSSAVSRRGRRDRAVVRSAQSGEKQ
jgi:hypothetical protein